MSASLAERLAAALPPGVGPQARAAFVAAGLPDRRVESWRYSALGGLEALDPVAGFVAADALPTLAGLAGTLAEQVAGGFQVCSTLPQGLHVAVGAGSARDPVGAARGWSPFPQGLGKAQAFRWLAQAGAESALCIDASAPVEGLWRLALQHDVAGLAHSRIQVRVRAGASLALIEHAFGSDLAGGLCNRLVEIEVDEGATLTWIRLQEQGGKAQSVQHTGVRLAAGARLDYVALELGALWSRHELDVRLAGAQAQAQLAGLVALQGRQHHDTQLSLAHAVGAAASRTRWKAVANQRARSVFNGLIAVAPGADATEAHLKTANLLLSPHAEIDTKPELVIEADEVACSHGATVGQLDAKALFYLRSRGIPEAQARQMLTLAFGGEVLAAVASSELRAALAKRVAAHLPQA